MRLMPLSKSVLCTYVALFPHAEKTIHDEEVSNVDIAESMAELKVINHRSRALIRER